MQGFRSRVNAFRICVVAALSLALATIAWAAGDAAKSQQRVLADVKFLASDELEGRGVGTKGLDMAADYIRGQFRTAGLKPALPDGGYFQTFEMPNGGKLQEPNRIAFRGPDGQTVELGLNKDFIPLAASGGGQFMAPVVFAGYGITAPEFSYDDYADVDVTGKVVLAMLHEPRQTDKPDPAAPFLGNMDTQHVNVGRKVSNAVRHGAAAVLLVTDPYTLKTQPEKLMAFESAASTRLAKVPLVHVTRSAADSILKQTLGKDLAKLEAAIDEALKPCTAALPDWSCAGEIGMVQQFAAVKNVLGVLDGAGPHSQESVVVGAHYDHLGYGEVGSTLAPGSRQIHNGADDNASGTAGVLELARRLARRDKPLTRRVLFMAFTGEERGLIGSEYYVKHPAIELDQTAAMINLDMIGRLRDDKLIVEGVGTAKDFPALVESLNSNRHLKLSLVRGGIGPSDHTSFCQNKIPVLFFWTNYHEDYHKPSDDWEKISIAGMDRVIGLVEEVVVALASAESRPEFVEVPVKSPHSGAVVGGGDRAYLGSIPAFDAEDVDGALLSGVQPGGPAEQAGIRGGDTIIRVGDLEVHSLQDLTVALMQYKAGQRVKITVRRGTLRVTYPVTLTTRPQ
ncbi:MAG: M28 family peptidase [Planctomycetes bacterium]|nr:M28 family peptidase [Planctomycetota bacterium]